MNFSKTSRFFKNGCMNVRNYSNIIYCNKNRYNTFNVGIKSKYINYISNIQVNKNYTINLNEELFRFQYKNNLIPFYAPFDCNIIDKNEESCYYLYCKHYQKDFWVLKIEPVVFNSNLINMFNENELIEELIYF